MPYNVYDSEGVLIDDLLINPRNKATSDGATRIPYTSPNATAPRALAEGSSPRGWQCRQGITGDERFKVRFNKRARQRLTNETGLDIIWAHLDGDPYQWMALPTSQPTWC